MAFDTAKQSGRNLSGLMSIQFLPRRGIEMGDSLTAGFYRGFAFATSFPVTLCSTLSSGMVSDVSVASLLIPFTIRTQEAVPVSKQRFDQYFNTVTFLMKTNLHIQDLSLGVLFRTEAMKTLDVDNSFHLVLLLLQVWWRIVLFQQSSNQRRRRVWIISDFQEVARIFVYNYTASFPGNSGIFGQFPAQICYCSVDTELIYRNNRAQNPFNAFFATVEVNGLLSLFFAS